MINKKMPNGGFTIIETLMAVFILSVSIAGALALASKGLDVILIARQEGTASFLAQDASEYLRWSRDTNCLATGNPSGCPSSQWLGNLPAKCELNGCYIDTITGVATPCVSGGSCPVLNYDSTNTVYAYGIANGTTIVPTIFTRTVYVQTPVGPSANEASTTVVVSWLSPGGIKHSVLLHDDLLNWQ